jgi:hypothetical protein
MQELTIEIAVRHLAGSLKFQTFFDALAQKGLLSLSQQKNLTKDKLK